MLKHAIIQGSVLAALAFGNANAEQIRKPIGVVELFTSQACSSCPPADRAAAELADSGDIIVLNYHVDYWNYLGWTDSMSNPENTNRQYEYGKALRRSGVYTPQAILNGRTQMVGTSAAKLRQSLNTLNDEGEGLRIPITIHMQGDEVAINIEAGNGKADVLVVYFNSSKNVDITDGENKGQIINYRNIVTDVQTVGMWSGKATTIELPARVLEPHKSNGCAILLQSIDKNGNPASILGATLITTPAY